MSQTVLRRRLPLKQPELVIVQVIRPVFLKARKLNKRRVHVSSLLKHKDSLSPCWGYINICFC